MAQAKLQYYHKGFNKPAGFTVDLRRIDAKIIRKLTPEQKEEILEFLNRSELSFKAYKSEIENAINQ